MLTFIISAFPLLAQADIGTKSTGAKIDEETTAQAIPTVKKKDFKQALNANILNKLVGSYNINYEYLFFNTHGVVLDLAYISLNWAHGSTGFLSGFQYRWHWSNAMQSGFLSAFFKYKQASGNYTYNSNKYTIDVKIISYGLNIGKRWVWNKYGV